MKKKDKISFIIPCYNEEGNISLMYNSIIKEFKNADVDTELVFVNDGSSDNTANEVKKIFKKDSGIVFINFARNFGKEAAIYAGLENCTGDYITIIDGDGQQPPCYVKQMYDIISANPDVDCVSTYQVNRNESAIKAFLSKMFYKIANKLVTIKLTSNASDFRLFNNKIKEAMLLFKEHNRFTKGIFSWVGFNVEYIEYQPEERKNGTTKWNLIKLIKYAFDGIIPYSNFFLKIPYIFGVLVLLIALILLIFYFIKNVSILYFIILGCFGITWILIGIIATYISRIFTEALNRPIYIAKEILK